MSQASSRKLATVGASRKNAKRRRELKKTISNRTLRATTALLSQKYGLLPCFCDHDPLRIMKRCQASALSQSSNAFWNRNSKSKTNKKDQRNNSTASETRTASSRRSSNIKTFRKSIVQRFKRNTKRKMPTITARSVIRKRTNTNVTDQPSIDQPIPTQNDSRHSSDDSDRLASENMSYDYEENPTLEPTISSFKQEQQNINATNNTNRMIPGTSKSTTSSRTNPSKTTRNKSSRSAIKQRKQKRTAKRQKNSSKNNLISTTKRKNSRAFLSRTRSKTNRKTKPYKNSPFPNPKMFNSIPPMEDSGEITDDNVHANHLCCKPITSVKGLSSSDQKKLIEHDYLTLISLLPIYLDSHGNFQQKIREKTQISLDGASELARLMNEWGSARLFIGANSHYKTLIQKI